MPPYSLGFIMKSLRISCQLFLYHTRMTGESNMQDFLSGVLTGMSVGFFLMGIIGVLLSLANRKEG